MAERAAVVSRSPQGRADRSPRRSTTWALLASGSRINRYGGVNAGSRGTLSRSQRSIQRVPVRAWVDPRARTREGLGRARIIESQGGCLAVTGGGELGSADILRSKLCPTTKARSSKPRSVPLCSTWNPSQTDALGPIAAPHRGSPSLLPTITPNQTPPETCPERRKSP